MEHSSVMCSWKPVVLKRPLICMVSLILNYWGPQPMRHHRVLFRAPVAASFRSVPASGRICCWVSTGLEVVGDALEE